MFELFIARRIYFSKEGHKQVSKPAVRMALLGIAIGLAVMIVSVSVVIGFKQEVRQKVIGFGSHIQVSCFDSNQSYETQPITAPDSLLQVFSHTEGVAHVQRFSTKPGIIKTDTDFAGMVLKGVGPEYDMSFFREHLLEGEIPVFSDSAATGQALVSKLLADKLQLKLGDRLFTYFIQDDVRVRRLTVTGIYQTNMVEFDQLFVVGDLYTVNRLNRWESNQVSGVEVLLHDYEQMEEVADLLTEQVYCRQDAYGATYYVQTIRELNPQIFSWLDLLDINVWVILILMTGVAGFTMISGLLIIILERTQLIGLLKAFGATGGSIRKIFLWFSFFLIGKGMLWGNIVGLGLCALQHWFHPVGLDATTYYVDAVPVGGSVGVFVLLNVATLFVSLLMMLGPSYLITRISPVKSIRYE